MKRFILLLVLALTSVSGVRAQSIAFYDNFEEATLNPFWNSTTQTSGYITFPSAVAAHSGSQCVQFNSVDTASNKYVYLTHNFSGPTYGDASVWLYDTGAGVASSNYISMFANNSALGQSAGVGAWDYDLGPGTGNTYHCTLFGGTYVESSVGRTQGWHQFDINDTAQILKLSVDGNVIYSGPGGTPFDSLEFGIQGPNWRPAFVTYFDDFSFSGTLAPTPEPSTLVLLGAGAIGLAAFTWRRHAV